MANKSIKAIFAIAMNYDIAMQSQSLYGNEPLVLNKD